MTKKLLAYLFFPNFFMAICAAAWSYSSYLILGWSFTPEDQSLISLIFLSTLFLYNLARTFSFGRTGSHMKLVSERQQWVRDNRPFVRIITAIAGLGTIYFMQHVSVEVIIGLFITGIISLLYYVPIFAQRQKGLRDVGIFKIFIIALVWSIVTVLLPYLEHHSLPLDIPTWLLLIQRFIFIIAITIPFDIRDLQSDKLSQLRTIPALVGIRRSRGIIISLTILCILLSIFQSERIFLYATVITGAYITTLSIFVNENRSDFHYLLFWDGAILLQSMLIFLLSF